MTALTKKDLLLILNTYQNYINDFVNISDDDLDKIYFNVAKNDLINKKFELYWSSDHKTTKTK
tara:strand:+ start:396 stop:584 length:189 start_codon:yes stop_codon:yes gene_type:complete